jgi:hypothetical protein
MNAPNALSPGAHERGASSTSVQTIDETGAVRDTP